MGPGYAGLIGPSKVTPSTVQIPGQHAPPPWGSYGKLTMPRTVAVTGLTPTLPRGHFPGPSYIAPPGPLGPLS